MAKRKFRLPGVEELNKDQDGVLRLTEDGQFLIIGGPGTGKSVVALLRAIKFGNNKNYAFLTYNKVLDTITKQLVGFDLTGRTIVSWFYKVQYKLTKELMPLTKEEKTDYDAVIQKFKELNMPLTTEHLIIDEGQDMPSKFYEALMYLGYENFFIVADQNQQITDENSSRQELTDTLGLEVKNVIELKQNYRNSHPIALLSQEFWTDPASPKPELPSETKNFGVPILYEYRQFNRCIKFILREADKDPSHLVGVIIATINIQENCLKDLSNTEIALDNPKATISSYSSRGKKDVDIDFTQGGIVVLNDKSVKGLEFDVVFIIIDGFEIYNNDIDSMKKRFYVMSSRAINKLVFFKAKTNHKLDEILPRDINFFKRMELS